MRSKQTCSIIFNLLQSTFCQFFQGGDPITVYSTPYVQSSSGGFTAIDTAFTPLGTATVADVTLLNPQPFGDGSASPTNHPGFPFSGDSGLSVYPQVRTHLFSSCLCARAFPIQQTRFLSTSGTSIPCCAYSACQTKLASVLMTKLTCTEDSARGPKDLVLIL